jgi:hypothetical protein
MIGFPSERDSPRAEALKEYARAARAGLRGISKTMRPEKNITEISKTLRSEKNLNGSEAMYV